MQNSIWLERRATSHARAIEAGDSHDAAAIRTKTRAWCAQHGESVPDWAKVQEGYTPRKPKLSPAAAALEQAQAALQEWQAAAAGRVVSIEANGSVTLLRQTEKGMVKATFRSAVAAVETPAQWRPVTTVQPSKPLELPRALREWRAASGGRAISIASDGSVTLLRVVNGNKAKATFRSLEAAAAAVEPPIKWESVHVEAKSWAHAGARH